MYTWLLKSILTLSTHAHHYLAKSLNVRQASRSDVTYNIKKYPNSPVSNLCLPSGMNMTTAIEEYHNHGHDTTANLCDVDGKLTWPIGGDTRWRLPWSSTITLTHHYYATCQLGLCYHLCLFFGHQRAESEKYLSGSYKTYAHQRYLCLLATLTMTDSNVVVVHNCARAARKRQSNLHT